MLNAFDRRVLPDQILELIRLAQARVPCVLGGGAALSGAWLRHRLSRDIDLFCTDRESVRELIENVEITARTLGGQTTIVRDAGSHVRLRAEIGDVLREVDLVHEPASPTETEPTTLEGIQLVPFADLRASKLTCLLSRAEPRDLVDVLFLDREGFPPESDLERALALDAGLDPGVLAWLLHDYPLAPLPRMLVPFSVEELRAYRDELARRFKALAVPSK